VDGPFFAFKGAKDCAAVHNTMIRSGGDQYVRILPGHAGESSGTTTSLSRNNRFTGNLVVADSSSGTTLDAPEYGLGPDNVLDHNAFYQGGSLNWWSPIPRDTETQTFDQDPLIDPGFFPENTDLVFGLGATDLADIPFSQFFSLDYEGRPVSSPRDLGAVSVGDCSCNDFDVNDDHLIDGSELAWLGRAFGECSADPASEWWHRADYSGDGCVDGNDLTLLGTAWYCLASLSECQ